MKKFDMNKMEDLLAAIKLDEIINKNKAEEDERETNNIIKTVLIIVGIVSLVAVIIFLLYKFLTPSYLEDFDEDFDDDFDDDFFDDEESIVVNEATMSAKQNKDK